eukprot:TRINITY_DN6811_c0_g1_i1.p1 TRINITY_DN6811_c0_g1~~TRINITY_DN6811_c0_g1_i1.p1  ORF type:complete len:132 (-),score=17.98 TRINITY_DN6811_c0_g1_i1:54-449(-)
MVHTNFTRIVQWVKECKDLKLYGPPDAGSVAFTTSFGTEHEVYRLSAAMHARGWDFHHLIKPIAIMVQIANRSKFDTDLFLKDLKECIEEIIANPDRYKDGQTKIYGMAASMGEREMVGDLLKGYYDIVFS